MKILIRSCFRRLGISPGSGHGGINQSGDTLLEILVALVIISLTIVAFMGTLTTSITSSSEYRTLASADTVLKNFAEAIKEDDNGAGFYQSCASTYQVVSEYPTSAVAGTGITVFGTDIPPGQFQVQVNGNAIPPADLVPPATIDPSVPGSGVVSATFTLPAMVAGTYSVALFPLTTMTPIYSATPLNVGTSGAVPPASAVDGYTVAITSIGWWNDAGTGPGAGSFDTSGNVPGCTTNANESGSGLQLVALEVTAPNHVTDTLSIVISNPTNAGPLGPPGPATPLTASPSSTTPGQQVTFTETLQGSALGAPNGEVGWSLTGGVANISCPVSPTPMKTGNTSTWTVVVGGASTTCTSPGPSGPVPAVLGTGTYEMTASYSGDSNYGPTTNSTPLSVSPFTILGVTLNQAVGGTPDELQPGDSIVVTFSAPTNPNSFCPFSTWPAGGLGSTTISKTILMVSNSPGPDDTISISRMGALATTCNTFEFGSIDLGPNNAYVSGPTNFSGSGANATKIVWNATDTQLTITLGSQSSGPAPAQVLTPQGNPVYTYTAPITDTYGDAITPPSPNTFSLAGGAQF